MPRPVINNAWPNLISFPHVFRNCTSTSFTNSTLQISKRPLQTLGAQIPDLSDQQFAVRLAQLAAMAGDEHTYLNLASIPGLQTHPIGFRWLDDGLFVSSAAPEYSQALRAQLIKIGDTPIDDVMTKMAAIIPGNVQWRRHQLQGYARIMEVLQGLDILPPASSR